MTDSDPAAYDARRPPRPQAQRTPITVKWAAILTLAAIAFFGASLGLVWLAYVAPSPALPIVAVGVVIASIGLVIAYRRLRRSAP